jgi:hypothetical protein
MNATRRPPPAHRSEIAVDTLGKLADRGFNARPVP